MKQYCSNDRRRMLIMLIKTWANALTWLQVGVLQFTKYVFIMWVQTQPRPRDWLTSAKDFWSGFFLMLHWGALGPIVNRFLVPFSILLEDKLYTLICLCKNTFILLSFEVWVTKIIHVLNVVLCIFYVLQHLSTWLWMRFDGTRVTYWDMNCMKCSEVFQMYC